MLKLERFLPYQELPSKDEGCKKSKSGTAECNPEDEEEPSLLQVALCEGLNGEDRRDNADGAEGQEKKDAQRGTEGAGRFHVIRAGWMLIKDTA